MSDLVDLNRIFVGEAFEDGSLSYTEGENPSASIKYIIRGTDDPYPAYAALINYLKARYLTADGYIAYCGIPIDGIQLSRMACEGAFSATCSFSVPDNSYYNGGNNRNRGTDPSSPVINEPGFEMPEIEPSDFQYSTVGGTSHLTHGYASACYAALKSYGEFHQTKDFQNGIGWNGESFEGCDVSSSSEAFSISVSAPKNWVTPAYRALITSLSNCVNVVPWFGYEPSCVLFKGMNANSVTLNYTNPEGVSVQDWYWRLRFDFEARRGVEIPAPQVFDSGGNEIGSWYIERQDRDPLLRQMVDYLVYITGGAISEITDESSFIELEGILEDYIGSHVFKRTHIQSLWDCLFWIEDHLNTGSHVRKTIYKPGFYYVWYNVEKGFSSAGNAVFPVTKQANLVQVYKTVDFNLLNLPDQSW